LLFAGLTVAGIIVLCIQYKNRYTAFSMALLISLGIGSTFIYAMAPFDFLWDVQAAMMSAQTIDESAVQVRGSSLPLKPGFDGFFNRFGDLEVGVSLIVDGLPPASEVQERVEGFTVRSAGGRVVASIGGTVRAPRPLPVTGSDGTYRTRRLAIFPSIDTRKLRGQELYVRGVLFLTIFGNTREHRIVPSDSPVYPSDSLKCTFPTVLEMRFIHCRAALRMPRESIYVGDVLLRDGASYSDFPADFNLNPLADQGSRVRLDNPATPILLRITEPIGFVRKEFEIPIRIPE
jgi:hypothetical protein